MSKLNELSELELLQRIYVNQLTIISDIDLLRQNIKTVAEHVGIDPSKLVSGRVMEKEIHIQSKPIQAQFIDLNSEM